MPRLVKNVNAQLTEELTVTTTAGAANAGRVPELNAAGILDDTLMNASATPAADKVVKYGANGKLASLALDSTTTSAGAADAGRIILLDGSGRLDPSALPVGIGADVATITSSEALSAGDYVNIWNSTGAKARKADASTVGKEAMGFVLTAVASGAAATVYFEGTNTAVTTQTPGKVYLSAATPGKGTATPPTAAGQVVQVVGFATSATAVNFQYNPSILLA